MNSQLAVNNLKSAIELNPNKWQELAKTDSDFVKIRQHADFKQLIRQSQESRNQKSRKKSKK
ncbi:TPR end-of-group domain-containing protein [Mastigocoleus testarum]|uniref:TPR end-of-group domain-containing protein n=1 Tax=Mastigocoleus testarum TaxID=996925 RepID=UPI003898DB69